MKKNLKKNKHFLKNKEKYFLTCKNPRKGKAGAPEETTIAVFLSFPKKRLVISSNFSSKASQVIKFVNSHFLNILLFLLIKIIISMKK